MRFLLKFLFKIALNTVALWIAVRFIRGFAINPVAISYLNWLNVPPLWQSLIAGGFILAVLYTFIRPILKLISLPFIVITLGLFNIVISFILLWLADWSLTALTISGFPAYLFGSILIGIANSIP